MTRKGKLRKRAKKSAEKAKSKKQSPSPSSQGTKGDKEIGANESKGESLKGFTGSVLQNTPECESDKDGEQAEGKEEDNVGPRRSLVLTSHEGRTRSCSVELEDDQGRRPEEVGSSHNPSSSRHNSVLSSSASPFIPQINKPKNISGKISSELPTRESATRDDLPRGNLSRTMDCEENGAGIPDSFESMWAKRWRKLEDLENSHREALDKQMRDARLKLEIEMNKSIREQEIIMKRREIEHHQAELLRLEEIYNGRGTTCPAKVSRHRDKEVGYPSQEPESGVTDSITLPNTRLPSSNSSLLEKQQHTMDEVVKGLRMPQRVYMSFHGEPHTFPLFMKNFEVNVESKETHDADRLNYLIQYCKGKARQAIEHCIIMPPEEGYKRAKERLWKNFCRNHAVTQAFLDKVISGPPIKTQETEKLSQLARDMETCLLGSTQLGNGANINSIDTLGKVVGRLPIHLRSKWAEKASHLHDNHVTPDSSHLIEFVQTRAAVANTYFGQMIASKPEIPRDGKDRERRKPPPVNRNNTSLATFGENAQGTHNNDFKGKIVKCVFCNGTHHLERCHKFRAQNLQERRDLVKNKRVCHACLSPGHFVKDCRGARICGVEGCQRRHHPLLHFSDMGPKVGDLRRTSSPSSESGSPGDSFAVSKGDQPKEAPVSGVAATSHTPSNSSNHRIGLQVVPVKVSAPYGSRVIETYAFLDSASNTTMCLTSLAEDLGADCIPIEFTLSTVSGNQKRQGQQLCLDVVGVTTGKGVRMNKVWTTDNPPVTEESIPATDAQQWSHLKDVNITDLVDKKVTILIGSDVLEALCPLEVPSGKKNQPHAVRTTLGWTMIGPLKGKRNDEAHMNFIHVDQALGCREDIKSMDSIHHQLQDLYNSEFSESSADCQECLSVEDHRAKAMMDSSVKLKDGHYEIGLPWKYGREEA